MTSPDACACDDCCSDPRAVFLEGGDELAKELREVAFGCCSPRGKPVEASTLAALTGADESTVGITLEALATAGRINRDDRGRVLGSSRSRYARPSRSAGGRVVLIQDYLDQASALADREG